MVDVRSGPTTDLVQHWRELLSIADHEVADAQRSRQCRSLASISSTVPMSTYGISLTSSAVSPATRSQSAGDGLRGVVGDLDELDQSAEPDDVAMSAGVLSSAAPFPPTSTGSLGMSGLATAAPSRSKNSPWRKRFRLARGV